MTNMFGSPAKRQQFAGRVDFCQTFPDDVLAPLDGSTGLTVTASIDGDSADLRVGGNAGQGGDIRVFSASNLTEPTIHIDGSAGDIKLMGGDCAEDFDVSAGQACTEPGSVMSVDASGKLRECSAPYDSRVVGVVSGAGGCRPGVVLGRKASDEPTLTIALIGKVFCKVDARTMPVETGDLLTTSSLAGHAMKADDPGRSVGSIIGKAMGCCESGTGLVPILVAMQ